MRQKTEAMEGGDEENSESGASAKGYFEKYNEIGSPFDIQTEEEENEDVMDTNGVRIETDRDIKCFLFVTPFSENLRSQEGSVSCSAQCLLFQYADENSMQRTFSEETDSDDDVPDELKQDFVDEQTGEVPVKK